MSRKIKEIVGTLGTIGRVICIAISVMVIFFAVFIAKTLLSHDSIFVPDMSNLKAITTFENVDESEVILGEIQRIHQKVFCQREVKFTYQAGRVDKDGKKSFVYRHTKSYVLCAASTEDVAVTIEDRTISVKYTEKGIRLLKDLSIKEEKNFADDLLDTPIFKNCFGFIRDGLMGRFEVSDKLEDIEKIILANQYSELEDEFRYQITKKAREKGYTLNLCSKVFSSVPLNIDNLTISDVSKETFVINDDKDIWEFLS